MLRLITESMEAQSATIPIRWCLTRDLVQDLNTEDIEGGKRRHLLFIIVKNEESGIEQRYSVPLGRTMQYIQFRMPGKNKIYAGIVLAENLDREIELENEFLSKYSRENYKKNVFDYKGNIYSGTFYKGFVASADVLVDRRFFAKHPSSRFADWVNFWYETSPRDECQFRQRMILALTIQPVALPVYYFIKSLCCVVAAFTLLFLGKPGVKLMPMLLPWQYSIADVWYGCHGKSIFLSNIFLLPIAPLGLTIVALVYVLVGHSYHLPYKTWIPLGMAFYIAGIYALGILLWLAGLVAEELPLLYQFAIGRSRTKALARKREAARKKATLKDQRRMERREKEKVARLRKLEETCKALVCEPNLKASLSELPKDKQTIVLRYQDIKARVCKPFAR